MALVHIPPLMRDLTGGRARVIVPGGTVGEVIAALEEVYPGASSRLCDGNGLKPEIAVSVDDRLARRGLAQSVSEGSEIRFVPQMSGG